MEQGPLREPHFFSANQDIPSLLWNAKVHYRTHKGPSLVPVLLRINPVHKRILFIEDPFEYYPPVYAWIYQVVTFSSEFYNKSLRGPLLSPIRSTCPTNPRNVYRQQILRKCVIVHMSNGDTN